MHTAHHPARRPPHRLLAIALVALLLAGAPPVSAAPGDLDPSFDSDGRVVTDLGGNDLGRDLAIQADGRIVVAGYAGLAFGVARYLADGSLDTSFDGDGRVSTSFTTNDLAEAVAIQDDGKIVVAGRAGSDFGVVRYLVDGSLDSSFDGDGTVTTDFGGFEYGLDLAIQADGKIVVVGYMDDDITSDPGDILLARYNTDGSLDSSFDADGKVSTDFGGSDEGNSVAIQADGKIVVAGISDSELAVARYLPDGSLDSSFDADGRVTTTFPGGGFGYALAIQSDGKILVAGSSGVDFALARYLPDGSLDSSFDTDGKVTTDFGASDRSKAVAIQADGKILVAGVTPAGWNFALARYNTDGSLDTSFDGDGKVTTDFGGNDYGEGVAVQADGKILVAGFTGADNSPFDVGVARYDGDAAGPTLSISSAGSGTGTVTSDPPGISCAGDCEQAYATDRIVTLTALPDADSTFAGFRGDPDCEDGVLLMASSRDCVATFEANSTIVVRKFTDPPGSPGAFRFLTEGLGDPFVLRDGESEVFANVGPGSYRVSEESPLPDYILLSVSCDDPNSDRPSIAARYSAIVELEPGETVTCTFVNLLKSLEVPTAANVTDFAVDTDPTGRVVVTWRTAAEREVLGFHLYRAMTSSGERRRVNPALIPATSGAATGDEYRLVDEPGVGTFYYWLEVVTGDAPAQLLGPIGSRVDAQRVFLPLLPR